MKTIEIVRNEMSQAHKPVVNLSVDLEVEAASGKELGSGTLKKNFMIN
jgi:hypothetical protein